MQTKIKDGRQLLSEENINLLASKAMRELVLREGIMEIMQEGVKALKGASATPESIRFLKDVPGCEKVYSLNEERYPGVFRVDHPKGAPLLLEFSRWQGKWNWFMIYLENPEIKLLK